MLALLPALLVSTGLAAPCAARPDLGDLDRQLDLTERDYAALVVAEDEDAAWAAFDGRVAALRAALPCLAAPLNPRRAARVHLVEALHAHAERDDARARLAFGAARRLAPAEPPGGGWLRPEDPEVVAWSEVDPTEGATLPVPRRARVWLDGAAATGRPAAAPVVWQALGRGAALDTRYVWPNEPLPAHPAPPPGAWALTGAGVGLAVAGGALLGTSLGYWARACRPRAEGGCWPADGLDGEGVAGLVNVGVPVGAAVAGVGLLAAAGGGAWVALSGGPREARVVVAGSFR